MALVLLVHENLGRDKHVESILLPRLDEGSNPSSSTKEAYFEQKEVLVLLIPLFVFPLVCIDSLDGKNEPGALLITTVIR